MKVSEEEFKKVTKQDQESLLKKLNQSMEKMVSLLESKDDSKIHSHLAGQQELMMQLIKARNSDSSETRALANTLLDAAKQPSILPTLDKNIAQSIDKLTKSIQERPSSFIFEVQRLKSGAIDKVLVKPSK